MRSVRLFCGFNEIWDRGTDGGTNFILRIKEQETRLNIQEHDDDDDDDDERNLDFFNRFKDQSL
jgi:hypothetical protein